MSEDVSPVNSAGETSAPRRRRTSLLLTLTDAPGSLETALGAFSAHNVNLTQIESRPSRDGRFDFYVVAGAAPDDIRMASVLEWLQSRVLNLLLLDDRQVPWFPRHISELDDVANHTLDAGTDLTADHPGFEDSDYRARRAEIDALARAHRIGQAIPRVNYTQEEMNTWNAVYSRLQALHAQHACDEYRHALRLLEQHCGYAPDNIPQAADVSGFLFERTGFRLRPVAGLLSSRDFLHGLAFRVFFCTQYIRHESKPLYTPEPDVCHELLGHAPMFADPSFAELSHEIGLASLGANDADIERLARCYWHSVEFGLVMQQQQRKAYGAGLLSSFGELEHACGKTAAAPPRYEEWQPAVAAEQPFPITEYQPVYFVASSLHAARQQMHSFCRDLPREFYARYNPNTERIWVDRAVRRISHPNPPAGNDR